ncbi:hypothetical protein [Sphingobacterium sp. LRF_L2]|uniref:hypothetical protein n=1 Tax=Sphingobacterium sp. LRF_L2 TaxID=3369421 RepID=UPI003F5E1051
MSTLATERVQAQTSRFVLSVDGQLNSIKRKASENNSFEGKEYDYSLHPRLGYRFNKRWTAGLAYHFSKNEIDYTANLNFNGMDVLLKSELGTKRHGYGFFIQNHLVDNNKFQLFVELDGQKAKEKSFKEVNDFITIIDNREIFRESDQYNAAINIGSRYYFFKNLAVEIRSNNIVQYRHAENSNNNKEWTVKDFKLLDNVLGNISLGLAFRF